MVRVVRVHESGCGGEGTREREREGVREGAHVGDRECAWEKGSVCRKDRDRERQHRRGRGPRGRRGMGRGHAQEGEGVREWVCRGRSVGGGGRKRVGEGGRTGRRG